jgi:hypothetical protein
MHTPATAIGHLQVLLGTAATDDALWQDLRRFEAAAAAAIAATWDLDEASHGYWRITNPSGAEAKARHQERITSCVNQLRAQLVGAASRGAAALYLNPQLWKPAYERSYAYNSPQRVTMHLLDAVAEATLRVSPPADWTERLARRMVALCQAHSVGGDPGLDTCVGWLLDRDERQTRPFFSALTLGDLPAAWRALMTLSGDRAATDEGRFQKIWTARTTQHSMALLRRLFDQGRLDEPGFTRFLTILPGALSTVNRHVAKRADEPEDARQAAFMDRLEQLSADVTWTLINDFRPETWPALQSIGRITGGRYLLRMAEEVERHNLWPLHSAGHRADRPANILVRLFDQLGRRAEDDPAALAGLLGRLSPATLLAILPHADEYRPEVFAALGWPQAAALVALLERLDEHDPAHSADPAAGTIHRAEILNVAESLDSGHLASLLSAFEVHQPAAVTLVRAAAGENRKDLRRTFGRRNQLAARALGLLPLEKPTELRERYLQLTRYFREANASAAGRKNYERAAAQAGLTNLAWQAGFADATRLEWAMEDQLGADTLSIGRTWEIEGYTLTLALRDGKPVLDVRNGERALKRVPRNVTREYEYREVKATLERANDQLRRYRTTFLDAMRRDQPLSPDELALLRRNSLAVALLSRLVLLDEAGACGLFSPEDNTLEGTLGERVPISGAVRIAHPYTLEQQGWLSSWQSEIVRREIVQPFKQVFRELYVITPAEVEAGFASGRLAGRRLKGRQAMAVLANLGWLVDGYDIRKPLYELGYAAQFRTGTYGGYHDGEDDTGTTGALEFWPLKYEWSDGQERRIHLADVPPLVFSEIMRDLDLVSVVAHQGDELGTSREVIRGRASLVRATVSAMGLAQVAVEEPYAHVQGQLTGYRIHLATGAVYLANGQYLCIVPSRKQQKAVYLPFEEGGEPIVSEIISKILLLANDARISDPTIVDQIAR